MPTQIIHTDTNQPPTIDDVARWLAAVEAAGLPGDLPVTDLVGARLDGLAVRWELPDRPRIADIPTAEVPVIAR